MNGFSFRYAVRMPSGELWPPTPNAEQQLRPEDDYSKSSVQRDMESAGLGWAYSLFGGAVKPAPAQPAGPTIFDTREIAEEQLAELRKQAQALGIPHLGATVVCQLCTPFTSGDPTIDFAEAIVKWVAEQRMQS